MKKYNYNREELISLYKSGLTTKEVASKLSIPYNAVYDILRYAKVIRERGGISVIDGTKLCSVCREVKSTDNFDKSKASCGYRAECKNCRSIREKITRVRYNSRPEEEKRAILDKNRLIKLKHPEKLLYMYAKLRAKKKNIPFDIEVSDIIIPKFCPILNLELMFNKKSVAPNSCTLDRIINSKGYVKGNVQVISWQANKLKSNASIEQLELLLTYLKSL